MKHTTFFQFAAYLKKGKYYWEIKTYFLNTQLHIDFESKNIIVTNTTILRLSTHCRWLKIWYALWRKLPLPSSLNPKNRGSNFCQELRKFIPQRNTSHLKKANVSQSLPQKPKLSTRWLFELLLLCKIGLQQISYIKIW